MLRKLLVLASLALLVVGAAFVWDIKPRYDEDPYAAAAKFWKQHNQWALDTNAYFALSHTCSGCHGYDSTGRASVDGAGNDINVYDDWSATMMAQSAKDPFWRAKVSHELLMIPGHGDAIQTKCTSCHAPLGHYNAMYRGQQYYTIHDMLLDSFGMDGVSCAACHQQANDQFLGNQNSGLISYDTTNRALYGPYTNPFVAPMNLYVGFEPVYSQHINDAGVCASCHTLITNTFDLNGVATGGTYVEQATYHEWLNSSYAVDDISCQGCHMPRVEDDVVISANYLFLNPRTPFALHDLVGGNAFMLRLMRDNRQALDINASVANYDETIGKTIDLLQSQTLDLLLTNSSIGNDTAKFDVKLINKAGHKFPSGYPSRRAIVEFEVTDQNGNIIFESGKFDANYRTINEDAQVEPHYNVITSGLQAQIYELVPGDVNGNFTTVLERAASTLKDNRLAPAGFTTTHGVYDTTKIYGSALTDPNFNLDINGNQGTGADIVHYHVPLNGYNGTISVRAKVWYQTIPPKWLDEMFALSTPEIDLFEMMFNAADKSPVLVASAQINNLVVANQQVNMGTLSIFPNPTLDHTFVVQTIDDIVAINIYDMQGRLLESKAGNRTRRQTYTATTGQGVRIVEVKTTKGVQRQRIIIQ